MRCFRKLAVWRKCTAAIAVIVSLSLLAGQSLSAQEPLSGKGPDPAKLPFAVPFGNQTDPAIRALGFTYEELVVGRQKVTHGLDSMNGLIGQMKKAVSDPVQLKKILDGFTTVSKDMREQLSRILAMEAGVNSNNEVYIAAAIRAGPAFRSAGEVFKKLSDKVSSEPLKKAYLDMFNASEAEAKKAEKEAKEAENLPAQFAIRFQAMRESMTFLDNFDAWIQIFPKTEQKIQAKVVLDAMDAQLAGLAELAAQARRLSNMEAPKVEPSPEKKAPPAPPAPANKVSSSADVKAPAPVNTPARDSGFSIELELLSAQQRAVFNRLSAVSPQSVVVRQ